MEGSINALWIYASTSPLLGLTLTMIVYTLSYHLYIQANSHPLLNPVALSISIIIIILSLTGTHYDTYFAGAQYIHFLLGPATVALAVPLYQQLKKLKQLWLPIIIAVTGGIVIGTVSSLYIARLLGADLITQLSLAPKSVTAPVAMGIAEQIEGIPSMTAAIVVVTGVVGALLCTLLFRITRIDDDSVKGVALGTASHGIGTAKAFHISKEAGAFSGLAMALAAMIAALLIPELIVWLN